MYLWGSFKYVCKISFQIIWNESTYTSRYRGAITVEKGRPFFLKLEITAQPIPRHVDLYKDDQLVKISQENGTIFVGLDRVSIPRVDKQSYAGRYRISASNRAGEGSIDFEIKVKGIIIIIMPQILIYVCLYETATHAYGQLRDRYYEDDPTRWC